MSNPFEGTNSTYFVLVNAEGQYSLWPSTVKIPAGWTTEYGATAKKECVEYIDAHWNDMRPQSLRDAMASLFNPQT
ncbi:MbtH family protein [Streptomyces cyanogenus]|uniref:MbtH-like protein n=1 Tax=Streptomyces cyanogenus TaxID=80860 RepID=A0ABX7U0J3_STRCY|nr:MbtH family NRPS accessory protein [Streptomyces cyanogenus]QTE01459.1 MbtH-like protein [Streptomyces cyanogenus]